MAKKQRTTIKDIAKTLGITPSAVSRALHDHPRISEETKIRVRETAAKLNYQPNNLASALRSGKSNLVGVVVPRNNSHFFSSVVENIEDVLYKHGYNVIITQSYESYSKECRNIDALLKTQVDGIIASMANETVNLEHYEKIKSEGIPLILFDRSEDELNADSVGINDYETSFLIVEHLKKIGCRRIAHIAGLSQKRIYKNRILGFRDAMKQNDLELREDYIIESHLHLEDGRRVMSKLLDQKGPIPDAVYVAGDHAALGALQVLKERLIKIPEDIALVGFSNEPFTASTFPSITTIDQKSKEMGKIAANLFLEAVNQTQKNRTPKKVTLDATLVLRESSNKVFNIPN